jgi:hypothetical protein
MNKNKINKNIRISVMGDLNKIKINTENTAYITVVQTVHSVHTQ